LVCETEGVSPSRVICVGNDRDVGRNLCYRENGNSASRKSKGAQQVGKSAMIKAKSHEATATDGRDNRPSEARRKAIKWMVSEPPGRNESERGSSLDNWTTGSRAIYSQAKAKDAGRYLAYETAFSGGVAATARRAQGMRCYWRNPTRPGEKSPERCGPITRKHRGNGPCGGRVADGSVVRAGQRAGQEGLSPSGAQMRGVISKDGEKILEGRRRQKSGGQGVCREAESEGHAEKYRAAVKGSHPHDEPVGQRWGKVEPALWWRRRSHPPTEPRCLRAARYGRPARDPRRTRRVPGWHRGKQPYK